MNNFLSVAHNAASRASELLCKDFFSDTKVTDTSGKDIKTMADAAAQDLILAVLSTTGIPILAEEGEHNEVDLNGLLWLVDPLDGTLNFSRGFQFAAVSIALWNKGNPLLGVVHDIFSGQVFSASVGQGAWLDEKSIHVSDVDNKSQAVLATGFPSGRNYSTPSLLPFVHSVQNYKKVRMLGSAALMLAQVAAGSFDVYEEEDIYLWDVAAGLALVQAAGGSFSMQPGSAQYKYYIRASNGYL